MAAPSPDCSSAMRIRRRLGQHHRTSTRLAVDGDALGAHLVGLDGRGIAVGGYGLADGDELRRRAASLHARHRRQRHGPHLVRCLDGDQRVRVLVFQGLDRSDDGDGLGGVIAAPAVVGEHGGRCGQQQEREGQGSLHRASPSLPVVPEADASAEAVRDLAATCAQVPDRASRASGMTVGTPPRYPFGPLTGLAPLPAVAA